MSNRDRIEHLRAEADAAAKEKDAKAAEKAARPPARKSTKGSPPPRGRVKIVWSVCDQAGREVQRFPYAQEAEANADAVARTTATGRTHFVTRAEVPFG